MSFSHTVPTAPSVPLEIERVFLVVPHRWREVPPSLYREPSRSISQGYLSPDPERALVVVDRDDPKLNLGALTRGQVDDCIALDPAAAAFLSTADPAQCIFRVRLQDGTLCIKGPKRSGDVQERPEWTHRPSRALVHELFACIPPRDVLLKHRTPIRVGGHVWKVDEFSGENQRLFLAEVDLRHPKASFKKPRWAGDEVTTVPQFRGRFLGDCPVSTWTHDQRRLIHFGHNPFASR